MMMNYLKSKTLISIFLMIVLLFFGIIYHMSNVKEDSNNKNSNVKLKKRINNNDIYLSSELNNGDELLMERIKTLNKESNFDRSNKNVDDEDDDDNDGDMIFKGHKIVHIDLKGAPFVIDYYKDLFKLLKNLGATGVLIEYEDMFPYSGKLINITNLNAYKKNDIKLIEQLANDNNLILIPLLQTFGHLEFILKLESHKDLREVYKYPQVICPTNNNTLLLLYDIIDQIISLHSNIKYLHIGADEVYYLGECNRCINKMLINQWDKKQLFLNHIKNIINYIKYNYPNINVLMWDDEFRDINYNDIIKSGINKLVEIVVWKYTKNPEVTLNEQFWNNYANIWPNIWIATAFKGATYPDRYYTDITYHIENHAQWLKIINKYSSIINFKGAMLTGWQRYDHFSILCELLPVSIPSLAINLAILQSNNLNKFPTILPYNLMKKLQCQNIITINITEPNYPWTKCSYSGVNIYTIIYRLYNLNKEIIKMEDDNTFKGWLQLYNIKYSFSNPSYVEQALAELDRFKMELIYIENDMKQAMDGIYYDDTFDEWVQTFLLPINNKIQYLWKAKQSILEKTIWPRRPFYNNQIDKFDL